ncbi:hypothetical protein ACFP63_13360 [Oerskovia jenensis]|uniref:Uncharacterized protein n=1 Tax=Oerskovia jenensis TaxID=162169 RepID=A0ABS2LAE8_9CELL|nr:hypothetical protein [Oerskovia jenensis]MBM7477388.1 hypothetical protein [Oerskovia jenensis]
MRADHVVRGAASLRARYDRLTSTSSARAVALVPLLAVLVLAVGQSFGGSSSLGGVLSLLGAATLAATAGALGVALACVAVAVLLLLAVPVGPEPVPLPAPVRQHSPTTPGRPRPRAPGASPLPRTA